MKNDFVSVRDSVLCNNREINRPGASREHQRTQQQQKKSQNFTLTLSPRSILKDESFMSGFSATIG